MRDLQNEVLAATVARLAAAIERAHSILYDAPEINMSNYNDDDVSILNQAMIEVYQVLETAMSEEGQDDA